MAFDKEKWAAIDASDASSDDKLARIRAIMDEEEDGADASASDDPADEGEEEEDEAAPEANAMATAKAIIALPEAKGREALANHLAFEPGMTVAKAKATLALVPKASTLNPINPQIGVGDAPKSAQAGADKSLELARSAMAKIGNKLLR